MLRKMILGVPLALLLTGWLGGFSGGQVTSGTNGEKVKCNQSEHEGQIKALPQPPPTRRGNVREIIHGVPIVDPYKWLEDQNSTETRIWIDQQNRYTHSLLDPLPIREHIHQRLLQLTIHDSIGEPAERNGYFFLKRGAGQDLFGIYG
jgi:hypothetical protein